MSTCGAARDPGTLPNTRRRRLSWPLAALLAGSGCPRPDQPAGGNQPADHAPSVEAPALVAFVEASVPQECARFIEAKYRLVERGAARFFPDEVSYFGTGSIDAESSQATSLYAAAVAEWSDAAHPNGDRQRAYCDKRFLVAYGMFITYANEMAEPGEGQPYPHDDLIRTRLPSCSDEDMTSTVERVLLDNGLPPRASRRSTSSVRSKERSRHDDRLRDGIWVTWTRGNGDVTIEIYFYLKRARGGYGHRDVKNGDDDDVRDLRAELDELLGQMVVEVEGGCVEDDE